MEYMPVPGHEDAWYVNVYITNELSIYIVFYSIDGEGYKSVSKYTCIANNHKRFSPCQAHPDVKEQLIKDGYR